MYRRSCQEEPPHRFLSSISPWPPQVRVAYMMLLHGCMNPRGWTGLSTSARRERKGLRLSTGWEDRGRARRGWRVERARDEGVQRRRGPDAGGGLRCRRPHRGLRRPEAGRRWLLDPRGGRPLPDCRVWKGGAVGQARRAPPP